MIDDAGFVYSTTKRRPGVWQVVRLYDDNTITAVNGLTFDSLSAALARVAEMNRELEES